jgi:hypothetical protein
LTVAAALLLPSLTLADSSGVPFLTGTWQGSLKSNYWDQSVVGSLHPKKKFKTKVTMTIVQGVSSDQLAVTLSYTDGLPTTSVGTISVSALSGFVGNFHLNLADDDPATALSGTVNSKGTSIELNGVMATDTVTHEVQIKLKRSTN